jgi:hypothetical protein
LTAIRFGQRGTPLRGPCRARSPPADDVPLPRDAVHREAVERGSVARRGKGAFAWSVGESREIKGADRPLRGSSTPPPGYSGFPTAGPLMTYSAFDSGASNDPAHINQGRAQGIVKLLAAYDEERENPDRSRSLTVQ